MRIVFVFLNSFQFYSAIYSGKDRKGEFRMTNNSNIELDEMLQEPTGKAAQKEEWRTTKSLPPHIEVSSLGNMRRYISSGEVEMIVPKRASGTWVFHYRNKTYFVRRLVAEAFLEECPETSYKIVHRDGNTWNVAADNLMWANKSVNLKEGNGLSVRQKVYCRELDTVFGTVGVAAFATGLTSDLITRCLKEQEVEGHEISLCGFTFQKIMDKDDPLLASYSVVTVSQNDLYDICCKSSSLEEARKNAHLVD